MDLFEIVRAAGRRWYVLVAGLILTGGLVMAVLRIIPLTYDVQSSVLLLPPRQTASANGPVTDGGNPFLNLGGLDVVAGVLSKSLMDSASVESIVPKGSHAEYTVEPDPSVSGSVLAVTASDRTPAGAFSTLDSVLALTTTRLKALQDEVNATGGSQVRLMVITDNTVAEPNTSALVRTLIVVVAAGLVITALLAISVDALLRRRKTRKAARLAAREAAEEDSAASAVPDARAPSGKRASPGRTARPAKPATSGKRRRPAEPAVSTTADVAREPVVAEPVEAEAAATEPRFDFDDFDDAVDDSVELSDDVARDDDDADLVADRR
ncbi:hypothetical protein [Leifsonia sp. NPDC058230]|uniref:hypothetical protein n=1 Tax=Leifsonia sp. NPDC058230 TaxID=3346391 RepID=UPI0036DDD639